MGLYRDKLDEGLRRCAALRLEFRPHAEELLRLCWREGLLVFPTDLVRDDAAQLAIWAKGRKRQPDGSWIVVDAGAVVSNARPGESPHGSSFGAAMDCCFLVDGKIVAQDKKQPSKLWSWHEKHKWLRYGEIAESLGLQWGGRWRTPRFPGGDKPHVQMPMWRNLPQLRMAPANPPAVIVPPP